MDLTIPVGLLTVDEFHALTRLVTDPASSVAVREAAVDSAWSQLLLLRIPFRYAIILVLAINDSGEASWNDETVTHTRS